MRRALLATSLVLSAAAAPAADAATIHVVRGGGWGHGIGLSQYGADGYAHHGRSYREILAHYYRGTRLSTGFSAPVRVLLQPNDPYIRFSGASSAGDKRLRPSSTYVARRGASGIVLRNARGKLVGRFGPTLRAENPGRALRLLGPALNGVRSGRYRGAVEIRVDTFGVTAINVVRLDPYVQGVVPAEMPSSWHPEALKAQAVAARSYALATDKPGSFDHYPDTRSQVYRGVAGERSTTNSAVAATAGQVLTHGGRPAITYFFSTSGGHTENVENVFLGSDPKPYLRGVPDPHDDGSPHHRWRLRFTTRRLTALFGGYARGSFRKIRVLRRGVSPRIVRARVYGSRGTSIITGPTLRARLGLRDSWAYFSRVSSSQLRPPAPRATRWGGPRLSVAAAWPLLLAGGIDPAPRGRRVVLERRVRGRWHRAARGRTNRQGDYRLEAARPGLYRVRAGPVAGPAVRLR